MKIKNDKAINIVIDGVELGQDEVYKILAYLQHKKPIEKVYKNAVNRLKKGKVK